MKPKKENKTKSVTEIKKTSVMEQTPVQTNATTIKAI